MQHRTVRTLWALLVASGLLVGALIGYLLQRSGPQRITVRVEQVVPARPEADTQGLGQPRSLLARAGVGDPGITTAAQDVPPDRAMRTCTVRVFFAGSGEAARDYPISMFAPASPPMEEDVQESRGFTDAAGLFTAQFVEPVAWVEVQVRYQPTGAYIQQWVGPPMDLVEIEIPDPRLIHCSLVFAPDSVRPSPDRCSVRFTSRPRGGPGSGSYLGRSTCDRDYCIVVLVHVGSGEDLIDAEVSLEGHLVANRTFSMQAMLEPPGPSIEVDARHLEVHVMDRAGRPISGADVRAVTEVGFGRAILDYATTEASGVASLTRPPGDAELCIGAEGFMAELLQIPCSRSSLTIRLTEIDFDRYMEVEVLSVSGGPVEGALVTVAPAGVSELCSYAAYDQRATDARGHARLPVRFEGKVGVVAYHPDHGQSARVELSAVDGARIRIFMEDTCRLHIRPLRGGTELDLWYDVYWLVLDLDRQRDWQGSLRPYDRVVEDLPLGELVVTLYVPELGLYSFEPVFVNEPREFLFDAQLERGRFLAGRVLTGMENGGATNLEVVARFESVPPIFSNKWCRSPVERDGSFMVFAPSDRLSRIDVLERGELSQSFDYPDLSGPLILSNDH